MWRDNIHFERCTVTGCLVNDKLYIIVLAGSELYKTELAAYRCPGNHIAITRCYGCASLVIGLLCCRSEELGIVEYLELHVCLQWSTVLIHYIYLGCNDRCIVGCYVDFGVTGCHAQHLLGAVITAEHIGVHEHTARCRGIEPGKVEHRLGLTRSKEMPLAIYPGLNPSVVVVGMRPTWSVHLTCRYSHCAQCCNSKG